MASIVVAGDTSGSVTIAAPAIAGTPTLTLPTVTGTILTTTSPKAGNVIQVVSTSKTDVFSTSTTGSWVDVTGYSVSITPTSSSSKILVLVSAYLASSNADAVMLNLLRGGASISIGDTSGSRLSVAGNSGYTSNSLVSVNVAFLDSPATTSSTTYKIQIQNATGTSYVNRSSVDGNNNVYPRTASNITVMEIAA